MPPRLRTEARKRASFRCEYCLVPEGSFGIEHQVDHVLAEQHRGKTVLTNLALACANCNRYKGPNVSGVDPVTGEICRLFNPRIDRWREHFSWRGALLMGLTPQGRATVQALSINRPDLVETRAWLMADGVEFVPGQADV